MPCCLPPQAHSPGPLVIPDGTGGRSFPGMTRELVAPSTSMPEAQYVRLYIVAKQTGLRSAPCRQALSSGGMVSDGAGGAIITWTTEGISTTASSPRG